jgi:transcriptional regulator with XRE-family HTH domain
LQTRNGGCRMNGLDTAFLKELKDPSYRHAYVDEFLHTYIAAQIRALREARGWSQERLAQEAGMKQSRISLLENVNYSSWNAGTLAKLAKAFDIALVIKFESFGRRLNDIETFSPDLLDVPSFDSDPGLKLPSSVVVASSDYGQSGVVVAATSGYVERDDTRYRIVFSGAESDAYEVSTESTPYLSPVQLGLAA